MSKKGCVYFVRQNDESQPVKIGYTSDSTPDKRVAQLSSGTPYGVFLLGYIVSDNAYELEQEIHSKLSGCRLNGEWFVVDDDMVDKIIAYYSGNHLEKEIVKKRHNIDLILLKNDREYLNAIIDYQFALDELNSERRKKGQVEKQDRHSDLINKLHESISDKEWRLNVEFK